MIVLLSIFSINVAHQFSFLHCPVMASQHVLQQSHRKSGKDVSFIGRQSALTFSMEESSEKTVNSGSWHTSSGKLPSKLFPSTWMKSVSRRNRVKL